MAVRDGRGDVKQTTTGFRGPLMVQSLTSAKSKFLSLTSKFSGSKYYDLILMSTNFHFNGTIDFSNLRILKESSNIQID